MITPPAQGGPVEGDTLGKVHPLLEAELTAGSTAEGIVVLADQARPRLDRRSGKEHKGREVTASLRSHAARSQRSIISWLEKRGVEHRSFWIANLIWVRGTREIFDELARRSDVARIDGNPRVRSDLPVPGPGGSPPAPPGAIEWNLSLVGADQLWSMGFDGSGVVIGGQDTGYQWDHPALEASYRGFTGLGANHDYNWHDAIHSGGGSCGADSPAPCDDHNHGTHTMGTMTGDDGGANRIGVAPGARWIGCRNMDQGNGTPATYTECFQWFVAPTNSAGLAPDPSKAPHVINNSWNCPPSEGCSFDTLRTVVENVRAAGIVVVASAGNDGGNCSSVSNPPSIYDASFSVGATDASDVIAGFSSRGPVTVDGSDRLKPDVVAPGVSVRSSIRNDSYASFNGTSMAGPHVAAAVALLLDARPDLAGNVDEIEGLIRATALPLTGSQACGNLLGTDVPNHTYGHGRIDLVQLVNGDADSDGTPNLEDCRTLDDALWSPPEPRTLVASSRTDLLWNAGGGSGSTTPSHDLLRSGRADDFGGAACVATDVTDESWTDTLEPPSGVVFHYLVRTENGCGAALGSDSSGSARTAPACS